MDRITRLLDGLWQLANRGARPEDTHRDRTRKAIMVMTAMNIGLLAVFWGGVYALMGYRLTGAIPLCYALITLISVPYYFISRNFSLFRIIHLSLILLLPFLLQWSLGGFSNASVVMIWAYFTPLLVLLVDGPASALRWLGAYLALTIVSGMIDAPLAQQAHPVAEPVRTTFFILNMAAAAVSIYAILNYFVRQGEQHNRRLEANEKRITELMLTDPLTGAANRRHLDQYLAGCLGAARRRQSEVCVIMADLDHFKTVNDTFGHDVGDLVLREFVRLAKRCIRDEDLLARFGGEEFAIVLPDTPLEQGHRVAERIRQCLEAARIESSGVKVTASFGVFAARDAAPNDLLSVADQALYASKSAGRNRVTLRTATASSAPAA
ncbi:MAG TPA: GGDEF domain-containing protein [Gammaproteobacteria bacterium]|nr:GGDEF domain-containing protein [Gammaproteobacteria bacterium]